MQTTIAVLLYGDYPDLAERCLAPLMPLRGVADLRILGNGVSSRTLSVLSKFDLPPDALNLSGPERQKYPAMRELVRSGKLLRYFMWFDDDSYISHPDPVGWLGKVEDLMLRYDMIGQRWHMRLQGGQSQWIEDQPWYLGKPVRPDASIPFFQGGWWTVQSGLFLKHDWPCEELRRKGGDVMLGALMHQQGWWVADVGRDFGVQINANNPQGKHSQGPTRGPMPLPPPIGYNYRRK